MPQWPAASYLFHRPPLSTATALLRVYCTTDLPLDQGVVGLDHYYSKLLQSCTRTSHFEFGSSIHAHLLKRPLLSTSLFLQNHLLNMYFKCIRDPYVALRLFDEMPQRNVISWCAVIGSLVRCDRPHEALSLFRLMLRAGVRSNEYTLVKALNGSSLTGDSGQALQLYALVIHLGFESNVFLMNAFLSALIRGEQFADAVKLFEKSLIKDIVSWNSMMAGFLQFSYSDVWGFWCRMIHAGVHPDEFSFSSVLTGSAAKACLRSGMQVHGQLVKYGVGDDVCVGNSLADMYLKSKDFIDGFRAFNEMAERDVVSWTQMAAGCLYCGQAAKALEIINQMKLAGIKPNKFTLATTFNACSNLASLEEGKKAHGYRIKLGADVDVCVDNALIDMYAKCGSMNCARGVFWSIKGRSIISWTTMIMGLAHNGLAQEALEVFDEMISERVIPNYITFVCVLYACSQGGLIDEGWRYFNSMAHDHGINPGEDHYACMVDLLGRAGRIKEAEELIQKMPFRPGTLVWKTFLSACRLHGDVDSGMRAAKHALGLGKEEDPSTYVLMYNMFANVSNWDAVGRVRELMEGREVKKLPGSSWIQVMAGSGP
ncbi:putative pentatricopeptide repeat-containing protein At3g15130 [Typha latifolia]|uniref:putative pentatricopeptide repeat-containing protein At3g15130 n=1 Tax=Typha latifolia TaxID=4733 RepID=UPI003C2D607C